MKQETEMQRRGCQEERRGGKKMKESSLRIGESLGHYITAAVADSMNITLPPSLCLSLSIVTAIEQHVTVSLVFALLLGLLITNTTYKQ